MQREVTTLDSGAGRGWTASEASCLRARLRPAEQAGWALQESTQGMAASTPGRPSVPPSRHPSLPPSGGLGRTVQGTQVWRPSPGHWVFSVRRGEPWRVKEAMAGSDCLPASLRPLARPPALWQGHSP